MKARKFSSGLPPPLPSAQSHARKQHLLHNAKKFKHKLILIEYLHEESAEAVNTIVRY
jgi:hypothetical protein